jgi:hypothetical protein
MRTRIIGYKGGDKCNKSNMGKRVKIGFVLGINGLPFFSWVGVNSNQMIQNHKVLPYSPTLLF